MPHFPKRISILLLCASAAALTAQEKTTTAISTAIDVGPSDMIVQPSSENWRSYNCD